MHAGNPSLFRARAGGGWRRATALFIGFVVVGVAPGCGTDPSHPAASPGPGFTATRYPIVLTPGFLGFQSILDAIDYWNGLPEALSEGGAQVFVTQVSQVNSSEVRGEQLIRDIEEVLAITGAPKVNLIGHSQGTLDARYVMGVRPDLLASVTSIAGPHRVALYDDSPDDAAIQLGFALLTGLGDLIGTLSGSTDPNDGRAAAAFLTGGGLSDFNARFPAGLPADECGEGEPVHDGIPLYSWSGIGQGTVALDPLDWLFTTTGKLFGEPNDGLVPRCASHFGRVIRDDYVHNHLDEINWTLGLVPEYETHPTAVFRNHANRLRNAGL